MLHSEGLTFAYTSNSSFSFPDIRAEKGSSLLILGESGKGKTTLLHLLAGLLRPTSGSIHVGDTDITQLDTQQLDRFRGQNIGLIFQVSHFVAALTVRENLRLASIPGQQSQSRSTDTGATLTAGTGRQRRPETLSPQPGSTTTRSHRASPTQPSPGHPRR